MNELTLHQLICLDDEDRRGDECRLEVRVDGRLEGVYRRDMNDGETWALHLRFLYQETCSITLFDEETVLADDRLGMITVGATDAARSTIGVLNEDPDARYHLEYSIAPAKPSRSEAAHRALTDWAKVSGPSPWKKIARASIQQQVAARVDNPMKIRQKGAQLCGPVTVLYELARLQPERYVRMCRELYETGKLEMIGETIDAPAGLLEDKVGRNMEGVDWMLAATLRNEENWILRVRSDSFNGASGYTLSGAMMTWSEGILGATAVRDHSTERSGELDAIRAADEAVANGGSAFLQIESSIVGISEPGWKREPSVGSAIMYDHWVAYRQGLSIEPDRVRFSVYTWGTTGTIDLSLADFKRTFHGAVVATGIPRVGPPLLSKIDLQTILDLRNSGAFGRFKLNLVDPAKG